MIKIEKLIQDVLDSDLTQTEERLLLALAVRSNAGVVHVSVDDLAASIGRSRRRVIGGLALLESAGWVERRMATHRERALGIVNGYQLRARPDAEGWS